MTFQPLKFVWFGDWPFLTTLHNHKMHVSLLWYWWSYFEQLQSRPFFLNLFTERKKCNLQVSSSCTLQNTGTTKSSLSALKRKRWVCMLFQLKHVSSTITWVAWLHMHSKWRNLRKHSTKCLNIGKNLAKLSAKSKKYDADANGNG